MNAETHFDPAAAERMKKLLKGQYPAALATFCAYTHGYVRTIEAAMETGDAASVRETAHKLSSSVAQFGLMRLSEAARALELEAKKGAGGLPPLLAQLQAVYRETVPILETLEQAAS